MGLVIDASNRIVIDGQRTALAMVQRGDETVVYTPGSIFNRTKYVEHKMPFKRYSLAHAEPLSGAAGKEQFEKDIKALLNQITLTRCATSPTVQRG